MSSETLWLSICVAYVLGAMFSLHYLDKCNDTSELIPDSGIIIMAILWPLTLISLGYTYYITYKEKRKKELKIYCPKCGSAKGEVIADTLHNDNLVYCHCCSCEHRWIMTDPAIPVINIDADHRKQRGRTEPRWQ